MCVALSALLVAAHAIAGGHTRAVRVPLPSTITLRIDPASGPIAGGTLAMLRGPSAGDAQRIMAGDINIIGVRVDANTIRIVMPPHANGFVPVAVTVGGEVRYAEFLYVPPPLASLPNGYITTVAGIGKYVAEGRKATTAFVEPTTVLFDAAGNLFIVEPNLGVVRRIGTNGIITKVAGIGADFAGDDIGDGRPARDATLVFPIGAAIGPDGLLYITDTFNHRIRRVEADGTIRTVAGSGPNGNCCVPSNYSGDGGPAVAAKLNQPNQIVFDSRGNLYILDSFNDRIRRVSTDGIITTVAGNGTRGYSGDGGPATQAQLAGMGADTGALAIDGDDTLYLAEPESLRVRRIDHATGIITTISGGGTRSEDGIPATESITGGGRGIAVARDGTIYLGGGPKIRKVDRNGIITTIAGSDEAGFSPDGTSGGAIRLSSVDRMTLDRDGNLVFIEFGSERVRRLDFRTGAISTLAGIGPGFFGENGPGTSAYLQIGGQLAMTADDKLVIAGANIQTLDRSGNLRTIAGGGVIPNAPVPTPRPALSVPIGGFGVAVEPSGAVLLTGAHETGRIRTDGMYVKLCCDDYGFGGDGGPFSSALTDNTSDIALDAGGNIFLADTYNHRVRRVDAKTNVIATVAGTAPPHGANVIEPSPSDGDGGLAVDAHFTGPTNIGIDGLGDLYVSDSEPNRIRKVGRNGIIATVLPDCVGPMARLASGSLLVYCSRFVVLDPLGVSLEIGRMGGGPFGGDGGPASAAAAGYVSGIAVNNKGDVFIYDAENRRIRAIKALAAGY